MHKVCNEILTKLENEGKIKRSKYEFPEPSLLVKRLKDVLEPKVDEKYYISSKQLAGMAKTKFNSYKLDNLLRDKDGEAKTLTARFEGCPQMVDQPLYQEAIDKAIEQGMVEPTDVIEYTYSNARRQEVEQGYIKKQNQGNSDIMPTLRTNPQQLGVTVEEPKLEFVGGIGDKDRIGDGKKLSRNYPEGNRVYSANGIAKTQAAQGGGIGGVSGLYEVEEPQPIKRRRTEYGKQVRKAYENHEIEANENMRENYIADDGVMPTLTASRREQKIAEPKSQLRIRKLTPKETWRLQGLHDDEFERAEKVISNAQLYKIAGNGVSVSVIVALLSQLGYGSKKWNDMTLNEKTKIVEG